MPEGSLQNTRRCDVPSPGPARGPVHTLSGRLAGASVGTGRGLGTLTLNADRPAPASGRGEESLGCLCGSRAPRLRTCGQAERPRGTDVRGTQGTVS